MNITAEFIKQLVEHPESETLDVKGDQYPFAKADNNDKSEILKDLRHSRMLLLTWMPTSLLAFASRQLPRTGS